MKRRILCYTLLLVCIFYFIYNKGINASKLLLNSSNNVKATQKSDSTTNEVRDTEENKEKVEDSAKREEAFQEVFEIKNITLEVKEKINGHSWKKGAPVAIDALRHLTVSYWGFEDKPHIGELIVNEKVAQDVIDIFKELYKLKYPIDKIRLIDEYGANDEISMQDNNSYSFCYREMTDSKSLSKHSYGLAIDINPVQNPYTKGGEIQPASGKAFLDRSKTSKGMIKAGDACYKAFKSRGWIWGGEWTSFKDYQHFEKAIR